MGDPRRKRVRKPNKWLVLAALICTPACFAIPIVGWVTVIVGWAMGIKQYFQANADERLPFGSFYGENMSADSVTMAQAPKGLSIFKD